MLFSRDKFYFDPAITYLNHGGFGVAPREVMEARIEMLRVIEGNPTRFVKLDWRDRWFEYCALVALRFGCGPSDLALTMNVTDSINAVLRSLELQPGDQILTTSLAYGAIDMAAERIAAANGVEIVRAPIRFPGTDARNCIEAIEKTIVPGKTKLAILDHVTAATALILPVRDMVETCRRNGVATLVDGAHAPGNIELDIPSIGADWYAGNLHKWYFVPRGCGFLWANPDLAPSLGNRVVPNIPSWDMKNGFPASFAWTGTTDPSPWLSIPAAFEFVDSVGIEKIVAHNHGLVRRGARKLAIQWGVELDTPDDMIGSMMLVRLPQTLPFAKDVQGRAALNNVLLNRFDIAAEPSYNDELGLWLRISAQIYNDESDYDRLSDVVLEMCRPGWDNDPGSRGTGH